MPIALLSSLIRPLVEPHLPDAVDARFFSSLDELYTMAPEAEIGWFDLNEKEPMAEAVTLASNLKWLNSIYAGLDFLPLDLLRQRGVTITNGVGINAIAIAEYVTMMMLVHAKGYREVVRAQDRREWLPDSPGKIELPGTRALLLGFGAIGQQIKPRLEGLGVEVVPVRRSGADGALGPDEWRGRLGEFDWVILAVPATSETDGMIGAGELAAMKDSAVLVNIARGAVVEQDALVAALEAKSIGGRCSMSQRLNPCLQTTSFGGSRMRMSRCICRAVRRLRCSAGLPSGSWSISTPISRAKRCTPCSIRQEGIELRQGR